MKKIIIVLTTLFLLAAFSKVNDASSSIPNTDFKTNSKSDVSDKNLLVANTEKYLDNLEYYIDETEHLENITSTDKQIKALDKIISGLNENNDLFKSNINKQNLDQSYSEGLNELFSYSEDITNYLSSTKDKLVDLNNGDISTISDLTKESLKSKEYINHEREKRIKTFLLDHHIETNLFK